MKKIIYFLFLLGFACTLQAQTPLVVNLGPDLTICEGVGPITVNISNAGGTAPYTYSWFPPLPPTPISGVTYCLYVTDAAGDMASDCIVFTIVPTPIITPVENEICFGDTLKLLPPYENISLIDWGENNFPNYVPFDSTMPYHVYLEPGFALIKVKSMLGCEGNALVNIFTSKIIDPIDSVLCGNKQTTLCADVMNSSVTMNWTGAGISPLNNICVSLAPNAEGLYTLTTISSSGCVNTDSIYLTNLHYQVTTPDSTLCYDAQGSLAELQLSGGNPPYVIYWGDGDSTVSNIIGSQTHSYNNYGNYTTTISAANDCEETVKFYVIPCVGMEEEKNLFCEVYPNPVSDKLVIHFQKEANSPFSLEIMNMQGKCLFQQKVENATQETQISLHHLPTGLYCLRFVGKHEKYRQFFVKK